MRTGAVLAALLCAQVAYGQAPPAPPAPAPAPAPPPADPNAPPDPYGQAVLDEQIAEQLVTRAQELFDAKFYQDAKQLAVEALNKSPKGSAAERARFLIKSVNQHLNIPEDPPPAPPSEAKVDLTPIGDPTQRPAEAPANQPAETPVHDGRNSAMIHGALYGGVIGATIGAYIKGDNPASVAVPVGIATGLGAGLLARKLVRPLGWDEAQVRTAGSFNLWGGVMGGLIADAAMGAGDGVPSAKGVLLGASLGGTVGLGIGALVASSKRMTRGDVALIDTLAGMGAVGGLTLGMLMQPAQKEAYSVNALLGVGAGVVVGYVAGPLTNTTPRRMLRVAGLAAAGAATPFLLYAAMYNKDSDSDEKITGALSTIGLLAGAFIGFRVTRNMDAGLDVQDGKRAVQDAPTAMIGRNSDGSWAFGGFGIAPLTSPKHGEHGGSLTLFGGAF